jgi:hypothetical protein
VTLKATLAATVAALVFASVRFLVTHVGQTEPKSQIDQIEVGRR